MDKPAFHREVGWPTEPWDYSGNPSSISSGGEVSAAAVIRRDDGFDGGLPADVFFRTPSDFPPLERAAPALCRGDVLPVGAGAGCHSLALQERGMKIAAIDISPCAVEVMAQRGVREVRCADVFEFDRGRFDTLLMLMHGIGMVGDLPGLDRFLRHAHSQAKPGGQLVFDSLDVRYAADAMHLAYQEANRRAGRCFGEIRQAIRVPGAEGAAVRLAARGPGNAHGARRADGLVLPTGLPRRRGQLPCPIDSGRAGIGRCRRMARAGLAECVSGSLQGEIPTRGGMAAGFRDAEDTVERIEGRLR